jgi:hypothetical protein
LNEDEEIDVKQKDRESLDLSEMDEKEVEDLGESGFIQEIDCLRRSVHRPSLSASNSSFNERYHYSPHPLSFSC